MFSAHIEMGKEMVVLVHEPDAARLRAAGRSRPRLAAAPGRRASATWPATASSSVVLPEPVGPMISP